MRFEPTVLAGCFEVQLDLHNDKRGFFARTWCAEEFAAAGLPEKLVQSSISYNRHVGTLRGLHCQLPPSREGKLVRCIRGAILDVVIDIRHQSPTFMQHLAVELNDTARNGLYIPPGFAHGFQTLAADCEVLYMMTDHFAPELSCGFRWNDPAFGISWPIATPIMNDRDAGYPDFDKDFVSKLAWT